MPLLPATILVGRALRDRSTGGQLVRRRVTVLGAALLFGLGLLVAVGLGFVVLVVLSAAVVLEAGALAVWLTRRHRPWSHALPLARRIDGGLHRGRRVVTPLLSGGRAHARARVRQAAALVAGEARKASGRASALGVRIDGTRRAFAATPRKTAIELNALGAQLRRRGAAEEAAEHHRRALSIFRELGDRRAEALTLNNIALAVDRNGDEAGAVRHFEQALVILRDEGDPEHEAQVIANLGIAMQRHGHTERARELLETALEKLEPHSPAAEQVEAQLRRAS